MNLYLGSGVKSSCVAEENSAPARVHIMIIIIILIYPIILLCIEVLQMHARCSVLTSTYVNMHYAATTIIIYFKLVRDRPRRGAAAEEIAW